MFRLACTVFCVKLLNFRESSSSKYGGLNDSELSKLKEKAKELTRVREKMRAVQEEVNILL